MNRDIDTLFNTFIQLGKVVSARLPYSYEDHATTQLQFSALLLLKETPSCTVSEFGTMLHLSKSSATQLVERLVRSKFVERVGDPRDRRIIRLLLTPEGEKELSTLRAVMHDQVEKIFSVLPEQDIQELIRINSRLIDALEKQDGK